MSRISDILATSRIILADSSAERWSDLQLIQLLSEGQKQVADEVDLLKLNVFVGLTAGTSQVELPELCRKVLRVERASGKLKQVTSYEADRSFRAGWRQHESKVPTHVVTNLTRRNVIELYPIPADSTLAPGSYTVDDFGISSSITGYTIPLYGLSFPDSDLTGFGAIASLDVINSDDMLRITYLSGVASLDTGNPVLTLSPLVDKALIFYIVGMALRSDKDTLSRQMGNENLSLFSAEIAKFKREAGQNFTVSAYDTNYQTGFTYG